MGGDSGTLESVAIILRKILNRNYDLNKQTNPAGLCPGRNKTPKFTLLLFFNLSSAPIISETQPEAPGKEVLNGAVHRGWPPRA